MKFICENGRIGLIPYTHEDDWDLYHCWMDETTQRGYNHHFQCSYEDFSKFDIKGFPFWATIIEKGTGRRVGTVRLGSVPELPDLAIWIYPEYRNRKFGTQALRLALVYLFANSNLETIYAGCYLDNNASMKMIETIGFVRMPEADEEEINCFTGELTIQYAFYITKDRV